MIQITKKATRKYWLLLYWSISTSLVFPFEKISTDSSGIGILTILNADSTMNVIIDEKFIGNGTIQKHLIPSGKHVIQLIPPDRSVWRVGDWKKEFEIASGESLTIMLPGVKYFYINSIPFDAAVSLNDSVAGKTPLFITLTDPNQDILRIQMTGYVDYIIQVKDMKTNYLNIRLEKDKEINEVDLQKVLNLKSKKTQKKILTCSIVGLTLISGITTIYLRQEADRRYDKYLAAGQPTVMNRLYKETKDYDRYAAIAYGTFQLSFISSLYFLFKN
ncbi:PEGA domain-containing protein [candidate division KSB1 bacterium]|nr:PEGA domain-containing protein [candidate division KSB1 bacterium]